MILDAFYLPKYTTSHALIIGINKYRFVNTLEYACNDAEELARLLIEHFAFPSENVQLVLDDDATRDALMRAFLRFADSANVAPDDRIIVFFAGHGHTVTGRRGEVGYLVPVDGKPDELASLIRWDELTRNIDLVPAKHMLFLMDACYGGLALTRATLPSGSMRFLKDMLQRHSRQVLTAGKANEVVSDGGGTRANHSIFTSHLLDGLEGNAASSGGIITGHGLMAYVYAKVGSDQYSHQTPHFGYLDGDGDFIFNPPLSQPLQECSSEPEPDIDTFILTQSFGASLPEAETIADTLKRLIPNPSDKIRLHDFVSDLLRQTIEELGPQKFTPHQAATSEEFVSRITRYEAAVDDLAIVVILIAHWGTLEQVQLLTKIFARIADADDQRKSGYTLWVRLGSYPLLVLMYLAGISALAAKRYDMLYAILFVPVTSDYCRPASVCPLVSPVIKSQMEIAGQFKMLPDMDQKYVPRSEHLYKRLQPQLEDQLFLGRSYEQLFDEFEIFLALTYADLQADGLADHVWGPPGRFAWKERGIAGDPVYSNFIDTAKRQGESWKPLQEGFFRKSFDRFSEIGDGYGKVLGQVNWW